jgi:hypothetical protein
MKFYTARFTLFVIQLFCLSSASLHMTLLNDTERIRCIQVKIRVFGDSQSSHIVLWNNDTPQMIPIYCLFLFFAAMYALWLHAVHIQEN